MRHRSQLALAAARSGAAAIRLGGKPGSIHTACFFSIGPFFVGWFKELVDIPLTGFSEGDLIADIIGIGRGYMFGDCIESCVSVISQSGCCNDNR